MCRVVGCFGHLRARAVWYDSDVVELNLAQAGQFHGQLEISTFLDRANDLEATPIARLMPAERARRSELVIAQHRSVETAGHRHHNADPSTHVNDLPQLAARIKSYELAFRMQTVVPEVVNLKDEEKASHELYGIDKGSSKPFGRLCMTARRLVEQGVRFVQIYHGGGGAGAWDAHSNVKGNHASNCAKVDKPIAGLLTDLKQRNLLDETLVVWGSEFGRTPGLQGSNGRGHHNFGFSVWMAGGGSKGGVVHGATDELGFHAVEKRHYITDLHATVMHQLGIDPRRLDVPGRKRLEIDYGHPIREIIA